MDVSSGINVYLRRLALDAVLAATAAQHSICRIDAMLSGPPYLLAPCDRSREAIDSPCPCGWDRFVHAPEGAV